MSLGIIRHLKTWAYEVEFVCPITSEVKRRLNLLCASWLSDHGQCSDLRSLLLADFLYLSQFPTYFIGIQFLIHWDTCT